jgi:short-subunit dehydrogenase involved in D-alanine esterification of teichoic acids
MAQVSLSAGGEVVICGRGEEKLARAPPANPSLHVRACDVSQLSERRALAAFERVNRRW